MGLNDDEIKRRYLEALQVQDIEKLIDKGEPPPPEPKVMLELQKLELERDKLEFEMAKFQIEMVKIQADAIKSLAQAEAAEEGPQIQAYMAQLKSMTEENKARMQARKQNANTANKTGT